MLSSRNSPIASERLCVPDSVERKYFVARRGHFWVASFTAMGSPCEVLCETESSAAADEIAALVASEAWRIEDKFSRYIPGNIVDRINSAAGHRVEVDEETASLIHFADLLYALSNRRFDITSGVLRKVWTFDGGNKVPRESEILKVLRHVGWNKVSWKNRVLRMPPGMQIDLGGIGKEYAVDRAVNRVRAQTNIACLVNFGGDLAVTAPPTTQEAWMIGRESLQGPSTTPSGVIQLSSGALATSGDTRRFVEKEGIRYGHILDPTTGWPIVKAPASMTVAADTCVQAGVFCTLAMLCAGEAEAMLDRENLRYWSSRL